MSASRIEQIVRDAEAAFSQGVTGPEFTNRFNILVNSVSQLRATDVNLEESLGSVSPYIKQVSPPCFNIDVFSSDKFAIFISVLNSEKSFPLHDTPGMHGIVKVIEGYAIISTYTAVAADGNANVTVPEDVKAQVHRSARDKAVYIPVNRHQPMCFRENDEPCILRPEEGNFHEIRPHFGSVAFIKVLAPPYDMVDRVCKFYIALETAEKRAAIKTFLVESKPDNNFYSFTIRYCGPQIALQM